ncbi:MAG: VOC family protein [Novosphingobium sp.]
MIQLEDVGHVAYAVPDLAVAERFLTDFGLEVSARTADRIYFRAAAARHHVYVAVKADESRFIGTALDVASKADLDLASRTIPGAGPVVETGEPGGGWRVTLKTPNGHTIWLDYGVARLDPLPTDPITPLNFHGAPLRINRSVRGRARRISVLRFGHFVLQVPDCKAEINWFINHFNLTPSDFLGSDEGSEPVVFGAFLRLAKGAQLVDHHCILINQSRFFGCHHSSFEVADLDTVMAGHEYLETLGYNLDAGVGRHMLGSLIYDYWLDPFGQRIEHFTDTDVINDEFVPSYFNGSADETTQWGMAPDASFFD